MGADTGPVGFVLESLQYNLPATSLIIQSIPPSSPAPVTAEQDWIDHLCETIPGKSSPYFTCKSGYMKEEEGGLTSLISWRDIEPPISCLLAKTSNVAPASRYSSALVNKQVDLMSVGEIEMNRTSS